MSTYTYRNLPQPAIDHYIILGKDKLLNKEGILEYCISKQDALEHLEIMKTYDEFSNLFIIMYRTNDISNTNSESFWDKLHKPVIENQEEIAKLQAEANKVKAKYSKKEAKKNNE